MSESDQFWQYAEEAMLWISQSKTEEQKRLLLKLVRTWTEAASMCTLGANDNARL
jgi:hypothetical protein